MVHPPFDAGYTQIIKSKHLLSGTSQVKSKPDS